MSSCGRVGLGHARLSVIDLETGDQPIANEDGTVHIVAKGLALGFGPRLSKRCLWPVSYSASSRNPHFPRDSSL